jgi:hypothetical protein
LEVEHDYERSSDGSSSNKDRSWLSGSAGYFLARTNGVEALRLRVTYYVIQEFRVVLISRARRPQLKKEVVQGKQRT